MSRRTSPNYLYILQAILGVAIAIMLVLIAGTFLTPEPSSDHDQVQATTQKKEVRK